MTEPLNLLLFLPVAWALVAYEADPLPAPQPSSCYVRPDYKVLELTMFGVVIKNADFWLTCDDTALQYAQRAT